MTLIQAIILGIVQGLTEFFPISSSAHLRLTKWFLAIPDGEHLVHFDLICHTGTLCALLIFLRKDVWTILTNIRKMGPYFLATLPLVPAYFLLKPLRVAASDPAYLGYALMGTSALLFAASRKKILIPVSLGGAATINSSHKWGHVLFIGMMQTIALIPGISRSGSTIAAARFCGWPWREAARFSFLLAVPTILGGQLLEILKGSVRESIPFACYAAGFIASFALGLIGVRFIFWIYEIGKVRPFAWYCLGLGLFAWIAFNG